MEAFIKLLTVQLANQNPLEPMNDRDYFAQLAQLGQVQGLEKLQTSSDMQQAQSMMGKNVTALRTMTESTDNQATLVTGTVRRVSMRNGEYYLGIQEDNGGLVEVSMKNVQSVNSSDDVASAAYLMGKKVGGSGYNESTPDNAESVIGTVIGVSSDSGRVLLQVKTDSGTRVLPLKNLEQIAE